MAVIILFLAAQIAATTNDLVALDRRIQAAMVANDMRFLRRSIADDFRFIHSDGTTERKVDILKSAALKPRYYLRRDVLRAEADVYRTFALVFGNLDIASGAGPTDPPGTQAVCYELDYVHLFVKRHRRWQLLSHRTTEITRPEHPCPPSS